jgi:hypothetical protein
MHSFSSSSSKSNSPPSNNKNANFAKEMTSLKEQPKEKVNSNQVDLVMVGYFSFVVKTKGNL